MDEEHNIDRCIICFEDFTEVKPKIQVGEKGIRSLLNFSKIRKNELLEQLLKTQIEKKVPVLAHKNCHRDFTDIKRSLKTPETNAQDDQTPTSTKHLRLRHGQETLQ